MNIQLLVFEGCPLAEPARTNLEQALQACGVNSFEEIDILEAETPEELRGWGSPTILTDGNDITGHTKGESACCRVYPTTSGVPNVETIVHEVKSRQQ